MACFRCGKRQTDPAKGKSPWARVVIKGEQYLICPECQAADPGWKSLSDRCPYCDSRRLTVIMGTIVCKQCGRDFERTASRTGLAES
jgi:DNA-directed RNA polymerase subunit RPC12/RpoP